MRGPTACFRSRIDLEIVKKDIFNISILKMPVGWLFKFQLACKYSLEKHFFFNYNKLQILRIISKFSIKQRNLLRYLPNRSLTII